MASTYTLEAETGYVNFSRVGFRLAARDCLSCFEAYQPSTFSPVKYFLVCRALELALKALHLDSTDRNFVKNELGHDLAKSYDLLTASHKILTPEELKLLQDAGNLYKTKVKAFEYIQPIHAAHGYEDFPDLVKLYALALRVVEHVETYHASNP